MGTARQTDLLAGFAARAPPSTDAPRPSPGTAAPAPAPAPSPAPAPAGEEAAPAGDTVLSVTALTSRIKGLFDADRGLADVQVRGELSNVRVANSGHLYFTLKDEGAQLRGVMFRGMRSRLDFTPEEGQEVVARGHVSVYEQRGEYQLYARGLSPAGRGGLYEAFEQLKRRLEAEGLFDPARKRPLPPFPLVIGVVTSPTGAAVRDVLHVLGRRWPVARVLVAPVRVQGEGAAAEVAGAVDLLGSRDDVDVVIVARGGGSIEDLWAFNEEVVARAIARSRAPVVTGVGHETDVTIADFVADLRAPTPSAAAELAAPDASELGRQVGEQASAIGQRMRARLREARGAVALGEASLAALDPRRRIEQVRQTVDLLSLQMNGTIARRLAARRSAVAEAAASLAALDPNAVLGRGYSMTLLGARVVRSASEASPGDELLTVLARGSLVSVVARAGTDPGRDVHG